MSASQILVADTPVNHRNTQIEVQEIDTEIRVQTYHDADETSISNADIKSSKKW
jgi:hypothetical protein